ncbi:hypothetical protein [Pseudonocardia kongjuensis]|uniref:hypothetical protein n=1 Tax=Pseudonocardia kongjuensis TaxID=102227 RepID=UPI0031D5806E
MRGRRAADRPPSLDGRPVFLVDSRFDDSVELLRQIETWFGEHLPAVRTTMVQLSGSCASTHTGTIRCAAATGRSSGTSTWSSSGAGTPRWTRPRCSPGTRPGCSSCPTASSRPPGTSSSPAPALGNVSFRAGATVTAIGGADRVGSVVVRDLATGAGTEEPAAGVLVQTGHRPLRRPGAA